MGQDSHRTAKPGHGLIESLGPVVTITRFLSLFLSQSLSLIRRETMTTTASRSFIATEAHLQRPFREKSQCPASGAT